MILSILQSILISLSSTGTNRNEIFQLLTSEFEKEVLSITKFLDSLQPKSISNEQIKDLSQVSFLSLL